MNREEQLQNLLTEWAQKHQEAGSNRFIFDGIVNPERWNKSALKVCFLLKESYFDSEQYEADLLMPGCNSTVHHWNPHIENHLGFYTYNLVEHLREHDPWLMWCRVKEWTNRFYRLAGMNIADAINEIAVLNLKKSNGTSKSDAKDILKYANNDRELIIRELELIDPDIVICGGTYEYCIAADLLENLETIAELNIFKKQVVAKSGKRLVLDCYHPAYPAVSYDKIEEYFKAVIPYLESIK